MMWCGGLSQPDHTDSAAPDPGRTFTDTGETAWLQRSGLFLLLGGEVGACARRTQRKQQAVRHLIGHHDTDNIVPQNEIRASGEVGILFRKERTAAFQGNRNVIEKTRYWDARETASESDVQGRHNRSRSW